VGSGKTRNKTHKETGLRAFFHNGCEGVHWWKISFLRPTARRAGSGIKRLRDEKTKRLRDRVVKGTKVGRWKGLRDQKTGERS
jgi:hypothetical protein